MGTSIGSVGVDVGVLVGVFVGVLVAVAVGVKVAVGVRVAVEVGVLVNVGVMVGPNIGPSPQAERTRLVSKAKLIKLTFFFIFPPMLFMVWQPIVIVQVLPDHCQAKLT